MDSPLHLPGAEGCQEGPEEEEDVKETRIKRKEERKKTTQLSNALLDPSQTIVCFLSYDLIILLYEIQFLLSIHHIQMF